MAGGRAAAVRGTRGTGHRGRYAGRHRDPGGDHADGQTRNTAHGGAPRGGTGTCRATGDTRRATGTGTRPRAGSARTGATRTATTTRASTGRALGRHAGGKRQRRQQQRNLFESHDALRDPKAFGRLHTETTNGSICCTTHTPSKVHPLHAYIATYLCKTHIQAKTFTF